MIHSMRQAVLKVFISSRESSRDECREALGSKAWKTLSGDGRASCLDRATSRTSSPCPPGTLA